MPKLIAELPKFDINTSKNDLLTKVSGFNPYPDKASQEFLVSRICHPMTNPARWIKYLATGQVYYVHEPLSYEIAEIDAPDEMTEDKVPNYSGEMWMTLDEFVSHLSRDLVSGECFSRAKLNRSVERSVVEYYLNSRLPVFLAPPEAHLAIIKESLKLIQEGDYYTAWCFVDFACRTGAYVVKGKRYSEPSFSVFEYTNRELAWKACPSILLDHFAAIRQRGISNVVSDTAHEVQALAVYSTNALALAKLVGKYDGVAREHLQNVLGYTKESLRHIAEKLSGKKDRVVKQNYLSQAVEYFHGKGVNL